MRDREQQIRDGQTGQYAYKLGGYERMCVCGHSLGSHCAGGFDCLVGTGIPQFGNDDNSKTCDCQKFRPSRRKRKPIILTAECCQQALVRRHPHHADKEHAEDQPERQQTEVF